MRKSIITILGPTAPIYDLTTVDAVNTALGITGNTLDDALMAERITQASKIIAELCNRTFALLTVEESFRVIWGEPVHALYLRQYPVTELTSISQGGSAADATMYELDYDSGLLWMKCGRWCGEIVVEYTGGYDLPDGAPALLSQATIETLRAYRFAATRDPTIRSTTHGDTSVTFAAPSTSTGASILPPNASDMIARYKAQYV